MMRPFSRTLVTTGFTLALLLTTIVSAQDTPPSNSGSGSTGRFGGRGGFGGFQNAAGGVQAITLLANAKIQSELELLDDQKEKFKKLAEEERAKGLGIDFSSLRGLSPEELVKKRAEISEKMQARAKEVRGKIDQILLPHQVERLNQISLQIRGTAALVDSEVAEKLKLSDEQKQQITKAQEAAREGMRGLFGGGNNESARAKREAARKEATAKVLEVLTPEQQAEFTKLQGDKIEIDRSELLGGFGQRGRGGDGRRGGGGSSNPPASEADKD